MRIISTKRFPINHYFMMSWTTQIILVVTLLITIIGKSTTEASDSNSNSNSYWSSWFTSSSGDENNNVNNNKDYVSPIINREIRTSIKAHGWLSTPHNVLCEAYAYHNYDIRFLDTLTTIILSSNDDNNHVLTTYKHATELALDATKQSGIFGNILLLKYSLVMRAYSPICELHRGLVPPKTTSSSDDAVAVLYPSQFVIELSNDNINEIDWKVILAQQKQQNETVDKESSNNSAILPDEVMIGDDSSNDSSFILLYANFGTYTFAKVYQQLKNANVPFVVRHLGTSSSSSDGQQQQSAVPLQGYGVRLDIRNVEYKVFDDKRSSSDTDSNDADGHDGLINATAISAKGDIILSQYLAGVNVSAIQGITDNEMLQAELWNIHDGQQLHTQIVPPVWQRRHLPIQASSVIAQSIDPLYTLQLLSQNLPSVASTLVHIKVSDEFQEVIEKIDTEHKRHYLQSGILYMNGKMVTNMNRPSFNVFELLESFRSEQSVLNKMKEELGPVLDNDMATLRDVQKAWMMGNDFFHSSSSSSNPSSSGGDDDESSSSEDDDDDNAEAYRIDVGRGWKQAIMYLNDVEKDPQYAQWPRSLRQAMMSMQFGMPPSVRRNLFTVLAVMDPINHSTVNNGFQFGMQLMQSSYPARIGVLLVDEKDVLTCSKWLSTQSDLDETTICPTKPLFDDEDNIPSTIDDLKKIPATAQAVHKIVAGFANEFSSQSGALAAYLEYFFSKLEEKNNKGNGITMYDIVTNHGSLMEGMQMSSQSDAEDDAFSILKEDEDDSGDFLYGKALRFAAEKGLKPGMSFLNGRPLPTDVGDESTGTIFGQEQNHIFGMVIKGDITDSSPKSVYAKLLKGPRVFQRNHPLLTQTDGSTISLKHSYPPESLLVSGDGSNPFSDADALFIVDALIDFNEPEGLDLALNIISTLKAYPRSVESSDGSKTSVGLAYRILPKSIGAAESPLCSIFAHASLIGDEKLTELLKKYTGMDNSETSLDSLLVGLGLNDNVREALFSNSGACSQITSVGVNSLPDSNAILANGRPFQMETNSIEKSDIDLLLSLEIERSKAVTKLIRNHSPRNDLTDAIKVSSVATFLAIQESSSKEKRVKLSDSLEGPLSFSWNIDSDEDNDDLPIYVDAVVDPVSDAAQRLSPLLRVIRDDLKLPLRVLLKPAKSIGKDAKLPITSYYRLVADPSAYADESPPEARFSNLPSNHVLTIRVDVPEPWNVQQTYAVQDTDNLRCDISSGCSDDAYKTESDANPLDLFKREQTTIVEYGLKNLLFFGQCYDATKLSPPNGLQLTLSRAIDDNPAALPSENVEVSMDGTVSEEILSEPDTLSEIFSDTLVMKNVGYWQLPAQPGLWTLSIAEGSKGAEMFEMVEGTVRGGKIVVDSTKPATSTKRIIMKDFVNKGELLLVKRRPGYEKTSLFRITETDGAADDVINVFSLATGHLYERFLKIMMLSVTKRTSSKVKFWLFENFLSPTFKSSAKAMAERIGCEVEYVTYKWPEWLRGQSEKQRIIWGYKILFLDVLFPLNVQKIIYVDADQVVRGDLKELWDMDLQGAPYGYTPFCTSREATLGYQFWREGFWKNHLGEKPYHISALYVVDLARFRRTLVGDQLRSIYQQLSADPNSLANLDQDLPNYAQHQVPIFSLPQEWLWCESWCSDETKATAKTIDLCNNPMHKEPKVSMAKRIISGKLFNESWVELDAEVESYEQEYYQSLASL